MAASLPPQFLAELDALGHPAYKALPEVIADGRPTISIRLNPRRPVGADGLDRVAWHPEGYYLDERPAFTLDPRLHQGRYYVQDASSMAVAAAVKAMDLAADRPVRFLDACAAPGGKTTAFIDALPDDAFIVANEFDPRRTAVLIENIAKWGAEAVVTRGDAATMPLPKAFFDIIAADVPCSGEGMMRKDPVAIEQWSPALVAECAARQRGIVDNLWAALRPGGYLVYSTCTYNLKENEQIIEHLIDTHGAQPVRLPLEHDGILPAMGHYAFEAYRFVPGHIRGEGLFLAMMQKPDDDGRDTRPQSARRTPRAAGPAIDLAKYLKGDYIAIADRPLRAIAAAHAPLLADFSRHIRPVAAGIEVGVIKGRDFIPSQPLALAHAFAPDAFPRHEIDHATALAYLRREAVNLPDAPRGIVLLAYDAHPLGFVKNIGSRANNLYPDNWRIRI